MNDNKSLWNELDRAIERVLKRANGKKVIIWGFGYSGRFLLHWFRKKGKECEIIIDENLNFPKEFHVSKCNVLDEISPDDYFVICDMQEDDAVRKLLVQLGYVENDSFVFIRNAFGNDYNRKISYYDWLDYYFKTDITAKKDNGSGENLYYGCGCDYGLMEVLNNFVFDENDALFDFGFGKGGVLVLGHDKGIKKVGGVEIDTELCRITEDNFKKLQIDNYELLCGDATEIVNELDNYSFFHMYNPFYGNVFKKVISNIEDSWKRRKRRIILLYSGVTQHREVIKNGYFRLSRKIYNDYWNGYTNIYLIDKDKKC